jgi:hypothetical protein
MRLSQIDTVGDVNNALYEQLYQFDIPLYTRLFWPPGPILLGTHAHNVYEEKFIRALCVRNALPSGAITSVEQVGQ